MFIYIYVPATLAPQILVILWPSSMQLPGRDLFAFKQFVIAVRPTYKQCNPPTSGRKHQRVLSFDLEKGELSSQRISN